MWDQFVQWLESWGNNATVAGVIGAVVGGILVLILVKFAGSIWRTLQRAFDWIGATLGGRRAEYLYERKYLDALIGRYSYLGLLPSNVAVSDPSRRKAAELEKVFVALQFVS